MAENNTATKPIGVTGLSYWRGLVSEEYLNQLKGTRAFKVYQEMADDCTIGALLDSIIMPLLSAEFFVEPASEDKPDVEAADFFESCRDDLNSYTWRQHVLDMMSALVYGFSLGEIVLKKRAGDKGKPGSHFTDGRVGIATIDPRAQTSLDRWQMDEHSYVTGFIQRDPNTGTYYEIPAEKLVHWAWRQEKRNPEGKSAMRSLYRSWYMRKNLELIEAIGIERDMAGMPVIKLPYGATEADAAKALIIVRNLRNDEEAGIVLPGPRRADKDAAGWELELLGGGGKQYNARETIRDYDKKILMRFFAQFLLLGMDKVGTQALVKGAQDFFALALRSIQQELLEVWNGQLIPYVFRFNNFAGLTGLPRLNWADPGKADIAGLTTLLKDMTAANIITASAELEDHVRSVAGLPDRPEGLGEGPRAAPAPVPPVPNMFSREYGGEGSSYASIAGTDARDARTKKAQLTNAYQSELLQLYDEWNKALVESLPAEPTNAQVMAALNERLPRYGHGMRELGADYIARAVQMGAKAEAKDDKALQKLIAERVKSNDEYINDSLLPDIKAKILAHMDEQAHFARRDYQFDLPALLGAFAMMRVRVGSYAGQAWYGIFAGAMLQGRRETEVAKKEGRKTKRVRWVLDPTAEHCAERPGYFGCPDLAHEYPSWDDLATVPGGQVACLIQCRCHLEVEQEGGWEWV